MPHVQQTTHSRSSHRRRTRPTHDYDAAFVAGQFSDGTFEQAGVDSVPATPVIIGPSTPGYSLDYTAPAVPTDLALTSEVGLDADGRSILKLKATVTQPTDPDFFASYVEVTAENDGAEDPAPIWTNAAVILIGRDQTVGAIEGVRGNTTYWARAYATDQTGNNSDYTSVVSHNTAKDLDAPAQPQAVEMAGGFRGIGVRWSPSSAPDLQFYEVRYAPDDGTGTAPDTELWQTVRVRTSTVWIDNLTLSVKYWTQVRAVDFSGNVVTSAGDPTAVDYLSNPEAGWTGLLSATVSQVGQADVAYNSIITEHISTSGLSADVIKTGLLKINTTDSGMADGIEIYTSGGLRIAKWDETGLYIGKTADGLPADLSASDYVKVTDAGLTVYLDGVATSAITPDGINATAVNFGSLPGGHNLVKNSSFELAAFSTTAATLSTWDIAGDFTATELSNTNATNGGSVTMTAVSY